MKKRRHLVIAIILIIIILSILFILKPWSNSKKTVEVKVINKIEGYGYVLEDDETNLHKKYFNDLVEVLKNDKVDDEKYADLVVQLFISDFYNLNNKVTKNDVGGTQYVFSSARDNMILKAKDTMYKYIESNIDGNRSQKLPIVTDVKISETQKTQFTYGKTTDKNAYKVKAKWTYKEDLGYQDSATFILAHEDNKLGVIEFE